MWFAKRPRTESTNDNVVRVTVYRNGTHHEGKVLHVPQAFDELLRDISSKFAIQAKRLFTSKGGEIDDITLIRDDDVLFASSGEDFADPPTPAIPMVPGSTDWVLLNVGGKHFATTRQTLVSKEPKSMLASLFDHSSETQCLSATDAHGAFLIDRCPTHFEPLLNYLRHGQLVLDRGTSPRGVLEEARFFGIESLVPELERISRQYEADAGDTFPLNRNDVVSILGRTPNRSELSFQGEDLSGADLSGLDLRYIDFRWAKLRQCRLKGADLSHCCLESADLMHANLEDAHLVGAKMMHANLENAYLRSTTMGDLNGESANLYGANLKGADLTGSHMVKNAVPELTLEDYDPMPDEELICVICHSVLREPVECHCRHVFCRRCITEWVRKNNSCPVCRKRAVAAFMPALPLIQNMVSHLKVRCRNAGCTARVAAESYANHVGVCEFQEVGCPNEACEHRCPRQALEAHTKHCSMRQVTCEKGCGLVLTRDRLDGHSCLDELKRKLDEASSERDDWKRKAEGATQALNSLHDTLRRLGSTVEGLQNNLGDLGSRLRCAETLAASGQRTQRSSTAVRTRFQNNSSNNSASLYPGLLFGTRTAQLLEEIETDSDRSWSPQSEGSHESLRDVDELFLDVNGWAGDV